MFVDDAVIKPWSVQVELHAGCNLRCPFCGINALPKDYKGNMSLDDAKHIAQQISVLHDHPRIEFAMRGEPLLHPCPHSAVRAFRKYVPNAQLMMVSNGTILLRSGFAREYIEGLFYHGLNILALDCYRPYGDRLKVTISNLELDADIQIYHLGDGFSPWYNHGPIGKHIILMPDIRDIDKKSRTLFNQGGNSPLGRTKEPLEKICPNPWREVVIHYNGNVPLCCDDWGCEYMLGNVLRTDLVDIWHNKAAQAARRMLRHKQRWFSPCSRCDGPSPGRRAILPHCDKATDADYDVVYDTLLVSPRENGKDIEWWGPE